jgi:hypothetical protein
MQGTEGALLSKGQNALFGILLPLIFLIVAFLVVLSTSNGEGPSLETRAGMHVSLRKAA